MAWGYDKNGEKPNNKKEYVMHEDVATILKYHIMPIPERGIGQKCAQLYGIRTQVDSNDLTPLAIYYPFHDNKANIIGFKKRDLLKHKSEKYAWVAIGSVGPKGLPFGYSSLSEDTYRIYITEGEADAACLHSILRSGNAQNDKYKDKVPNVVSIPTGTATAAEHILHNIDFYGKYKEIVLCFDNDEAVGDEIEKGIMKGKEAIADVVLSHPELNIKYLPLELKDPCEYFAEGRKKELYSIACYGAKEYFPETLIKYDVEEDTLDRLMKPLSKGIYLDTIPKTSAMLHGFRPNELTTILASPKVGKTSLLKQLCMELAKKHGKKIANFYLEEDLTKAQQSYIALYNDLRTAAYREKPTLLSREQVKQTIGELESQMLFFDSSKVGALDPISVERMIRHCAVLGYDFLVFDHISFVATEMKDERRGLDKMITDISIVARNYPIHIFVIAHITPGDQKPPIDAETKEIVYPYYEELKTINARGSKIFGQVSHNIIALEKEVIDDKGTKGKVRVKITDSREWGTTGIGDILVFDTVTGKFG